MISEISSALLALINSKPRSPTKEEIEEVVRQTYETMWGHIRREATAGRIAVAGDRAGEWRFVSKAEFAWPSQLKPGDSLEKDVGEAVNAMAERWRKAFGVAPAVPQSMISAANVFLAANQWPKMVEPADPEPIADGGDAYL